ncbi:MAG: phosphoadenosine phosphosulfate reductase family protein [Anaerolineae bacterium]|nr:phosphoadenosine phosphosulfate reductase family protein [Anaerolineae bacterium]
MNTSQHSFDGRPARHIVSLSGGKDSTALAIYLRDRIPELEYVFCDTGKELPETYEYMDRLEVYLGKGVIRLNSDRDFDHYLQIYNNVLPDARTRWCTRKLKIEPFERYVGEDLCYNYIGIRADEPQRKGYISTKPNIIAAYPFIEDGITKQDVFRILEDSGLGLPAYYEWRSRSGCYFCFFQQRIEWVGLQKNHPDLYQRAMEYEKIDLETGETYTWSQRESLRDLMQPDRIAAIIEEYERRKASKRNGRDQTLLQVFRFSDLAEYEEGEACLICHL